jgi:hypothetical protein
VDATVPMAFAKVGAAQAFLDYVGERTLLVRDVLDELRRHRQRFSNLCPLIAFFEAEGDRRVLDLAPRHVLAVDDLAAVHHAPGDPPTRNRGEIATVYGAIALRRQCRGVLVGMDDHLGKQLCRQRRIPAADTPSLLVEMVCAGALTYETGGRIWRSGLFDNNRTAWRAYRTRLQEAL